MDLRNGSIRKMRIFMIVLISVITFSILVLVYNFCLAYKVEEYFPLEEGNIWNYRVSGSGENTGDIDTVKINGKEIINSLETMLLIEQRGEYLCIALTPKGLEKFKFSDQVEEYSIYIPSRIILPADMDIGETREYKINQINYFLKSGEKWDERSVVDKITFKAIEDVEVPAGYFKDCLRFCYDINWKQYKRNQLEYANEIHTIWYAPGVGIVKHLFYKIEYDPPPKPFWMDRKRELLSAFIKGKRIGK